MNTTIQRDRTLRKHYSEWMNGAQVQLAAEIDCLKDQQLGRCLAHHRFVVKYPADWFPPDMPTTKEGYIMAKRSWSSKGKHYLDCDVLQPVEHRGCKIVLPISEPPLSKKQIKAGERKNYLWWLRKLLDTVFNEPRTLEDIGLKSTLVEQ
eukprot:1056082-Rhodomonas_salina.1